jgi:hypothetical protein
VYGADAATWSAVRRALRDGQAPDARTDALARDLAIRTPRNACWWNCSSASWRCRSVRATSRFTTPVCSGSLILAAPGLLPDLTATITYWAFMNKLAELGATPTSERVVQHLDQRIITAAGVSAGIDMALGLAEPLTDQVTAEAMQLIMEYDPQPPFDAGSVEKAGPTVVNKAREIIKIKGWTNRRTGCRSATRMDAPAGSPPRRPGQVHVLRGNADNSESVTASSQPYTMTFGRLWNC